MKESVATSTPEDILREELKVQLEKLKMTPDAPMAQLEEPTDEPKPEFTSEGIKAMSGQQFREARRDPVKRAKIDAIIAEDNATREAKAQEELAKAAEEVIEQTPESDELAEEAQRLADEAKAAELAEAEKAKVEAAKVEETKAAELRAAEEKAKEVVKPEKIVVDYQVKDDNGNPIGRPTHLEADTWQEMFEKQKVAYEHAVKALERKKKQVATIKKEEPKVQMTDAEIVQLAKEIKDEDPMKAAAAVRKLTGTEEHEKQQEELRKQTEFARQQGESLKFLTGHVKDYNNCEANNQLLGGYLEDNNLEWTAGNLEIAFDALESQLAQVVTAAIPAPAPVVVPVSEPVAPIAPVQAVPAAEVVSAPAAPVAPVTPPAAAPNAPTAERKLPPGGLQPGSLSGRRPVLKPAGMTWADIQKMSGPEMRAAMRIPSKRAEIEKVIADYRNRQK